MGNTADLRQATKSHLKEAACCIQAPYWNVEWKEELRKKWQNNRDIESLEFLVGDNLGSHFICYWSSESKVNTASYQDVLERFMLLLAHKIYRDDDFIFQEDLAPGSTATGTNTCFNLPG